VLLMAPLLALHDRALLRVAPRDLPLLAVLGVTMALCQFGYYTAIQHIQVAAGILLQYLSHIDRNDLLLSGRRAGQYRRCQDHACRRANRRESTDDP